MTTGDRERLESLRRQPLVIVLNSVYVQCKRCGGSIKLSETCLYDPAHWVTHRARCDKWSDAQVAAKRERNAMGASRLSTPSLTPDDDSELTELSVNSERSLSPSPSPGTADGKIVQGPLTSHVNCMEYFELAHPGLEVIDFNAPLPTVPTWSFERLKLPTCIDAGQADEHRRRCTFSAVNWDEVDLDDEDPDAGPQRSTEPSPGPCNSVPSDQAMPES
ncbi:hypothetical protein C8Q80DRAFT_247473 [Daedaleopsis nitida]|nr:hypothetical protein C8Q80DRAFT_247473 [Daedaleopsis nitida]